MKESISLELDMINILSVPLSALIVSNYPLTLSFSIRLVQILSMSGNRKK